MAKFRIKCYSLQWTKERFEETKKDWSGITGLVVLDFCVALNCVEKEVSFVSVKKVASEDEQVYLVPLCKKHGAFKEECEVYDYYLAPQ